MRLFSCQCCGQMVYFENVSCIRCGALLGFAPDAMRIVSLSDEGDGTLTAAGKPAPGGGQPARYRHCANRVQHEVCNWLVAADDEHELCVACRLNRTIPDLSQPDNVVLWGRIEAEKRRLVYGLMRLGLPVVPQSEAETGLAFDFLADPDPTFNERARVLTGHADGLITLNIAEADPVVREQMRADMAEPYRTLLGHFRHESGHYYWDRLVRDTQWLEEVRALFGDDTEDYQAALQRNYQEGPPADWPEHYVSAYASTHAWEDWAETWAHYLHIVDTLDTARAFGLKVNPKVATSDDLAVDTMIDANREADFQVIMDHWLPLTFALNSLNRSMGQDDVYPFVIPPAVVEKLGLVHKIVQHARVN